MIVFSMASGFQVDRFGDSLKLCTKESTEEGHDHICALEPEAALRRRTSTSSEVTDSAMTRDIPVSGCNSLNGAINRVSTRSSDDRLPTMNDTRCGNG